MAKRAEKPVKECSNCGGVFHKSGQLSYKQWDGQKFCSVRCRAEGDSRSKLSARPPLEEIFHSSYTQCESGCWEWSGPISTQGYGTFRWKKKLYRAHMLSLEIFGQPRPEGLAACHHCDNPRCVNPDHLYWGTPADNVGDASRRGRLLTGEKHTQSKLTVAAVEAIRNSGETNTDLSRRYGVSRPAIANVRSGKTWRTVT